MNQIFIDSIPEWDRITGNHTDIDKLMESLSRDEAEETPHNGDIADEIIAMMKGFVLKYGDGVYVYFTHLLEAIAKAEATGHNRKEL